LKESLYIQRNAIEIGIPQLRITHISCRCRVFASEGKTTMSADAAHTSWWQIGEIVFGAPLLAAVALQFIVPLSYFNPIFTATFLVIGVTLCAVGIALIVAARRVLSTFDQPTDPGLPTSLMVTNGIFSISRNPMYLGATCVLIGIALVFKLAWVFVFLVPTLIACQSILIESEERYLAAKFGTEYQRYATSVNRWIGRRMQ
jgi:protein-S-isoprenylcysteine O-methyltransferase Ste14